MIKNFFLTNQFARRVSIFFNQLVVPLLIKASLILAALLLVVFFALKLFKPDLLTKIQHKSSFYFLHIFSLDGYDFSEIKVSGNARVSSDQIKEIALLTQKNFLESAKNGEEKNYQPLIHNLIAEIKKQQPWINKVVISRTMPNVLNIAVSEFEPFAIWQNDGQKFVTDKDGNLIPVAQDDEEFSHMIILSGSGANLHVKSLFNIVVIDPELSKMVYSATWVGDRRWDIRLENGLLIKMPEDNISAAWQRLIKVKNTPGSLIGLKIIDLRLKDKIYLEYDDSVMKELKSI